MLLFMDGMDAYATAQMYLRWTSGGSFDVHAANGRRGGNALRNNDTNGQIRKVFGGTATTIIAGFAFQQQILGRSICTFQEGSTIHVDLRTDAGGHLVVTRNGTVLATSTATISATVWNYFEIKATISDTVGAITVRLNSVAVITATGLDTRNGGTGFIDTLLFGQAGILAAGADHYDDVYICDTTGAVNNDFLGDVRCEVLLPSGAGAHTDFTPSAGSNYQNVDDATPNDDTDYNSSSTAAQKDTFAYGNLSAATGTLYAVQHLLYRRKDDAGARTMRPVARISATDYPGATVGMPSSYDYDAQIVEQSPASSAAWTVTEVNAAEFGYELVA